MTINGSVSPGSPISVTGTKDSSLAIYSPANPSVVCGDPGLFDLGNPLMIHEGTGAPAQTLMLTGSAQSVVLSTPTLLGQTLCLRATNAAGPTYASQSVAAAAVKVEFAVKPTGALNAISVQGDANAKVGILELPASYTPNPKSDSCSANDLANGQWLAIGLGAPTTTSIPLSGTPPFAIALNKPLVAGAQLCLVAQETSGGATTTYYSQFATVQAAVAAAPALDFTGTPASGDTSLVINGTGGDIVTVYQFSNSADGDCASLLKDHEGKVVPVTLSGSNSTSSNSTPLGTTPPFTVSLASPLLPQEKLCLQQTDKSGNSPQYSGLISVSDSNNPYPRVRTFYTIGAMINNQNGSSGSSSGAEYVDLGLGFAVVPESGTGYRPGLNASISGRFSAIPVTAPSSTTSTSNNSGTLNILSSQESARVLGSITFPLRASQILGGGYSFFTAPVLKAGFDTLLNPAASATTGSSGSATISPATFAPVYWEYSSGLRMGYRQYLTGKDSTPRTITQVDITIGKFSNLQSFVCNRSVTSGNSTSLPTNTMCFNPQPPNAGPYTLDQSRATLYRMEVEGFFLFPGTPFVLGVDANLPQSAAAPKNLDTLNKAGGNVTIYFGVSGSLTNLFKSMKLPGSSQ
ncbi:MAG: hypothetical protein ABR956_14860 [Terracidiphilus sp.]